MDTDYIQVHMLKIEKQYYYYASRGMKPWEIRINDRNFQCEDRVILQEWDKAKEKYTGREIHGTITYILDKFPALEPGYVAFTVDFDKQGKSIKEFFRCPQFKKRHRKFCRGTSIQKNIKKYT
ncbi:MAG: DUF3850 domain-containing protein [Eubacterium sp.]|nr:DUF3850 domain-containing protein [Eubacterium sp.]